MPRSDAQIKTPRFVILASLCVVVAALYFAQDVLIPVALAIMLSFLLAPLVTRLERLRLPRPAAVTMVVTVLFFLLGVLAWVVLLQVEDLAGQLPKYQDNIASKIRNIRGHGDSRLERAAQAITRAAEAATTAPSTQEGEQITAITGAPLGSSDLNPIHTKSVNEHSSSLDILGGYVGTILGPFGTLGIVIVFVIFMLLQREDLRDRIIRLVGEGQLHVTTQALDDATSRISRYLAAQALVNGTYGVAITIGLCIIGFTLGGGWFPSFVLWGLLCALLRFIPYIGPWIGAAFPIVISFAVYNGYGVFAAVLGLFVIIELLSNNLMEPWLYGSSTGISTVAILVSAVFWTWLWGPVGLLLATPLTVCIVVVGKYVPQLAFLDILLGDEPVLEPHQRLYQRLLATDHEEAADLAEEHLREQSLEAVYNNIILPALALAEHDRHSGRLDEARGMGMRQALRDIIEELADVDRLNRIRAAADETARAAKSDSAVVTPKVETTLPIRAPIPKDSMINVLCLPAHDEADEMVGIMLSELLRVYGYNAIAISQNALASEMLDEIEKRKADIVCISALPPAAVAHSRYLCKRLSAKYPNIVPVLGLWTFKGDIKKGKARIACATDAPIVTTLTLAIEQIVEIAQPLVIRKDDPTKQNELTAAETAARE